MTTKKVALKSFDKIYLGKCEGNPTQVHKLLKVIDKELVKSDFRIKITFAETKLGTHGWAKQRRLIPQNVIIYKQIHIKLNNNDDYRWQLFVTLHEIAHINIGLDNNHNKVWLKEALRLYKKYKLIEWVAEQFELSLYGTYPNEQKAIIKEAIKIENRKTKTS